MIKKAILQGSPGQEADKNFGGVVCDFNSHLLSDLLLNPLPLPTKVCLLARKTDPSSASTIENNQDLSRQLNAFERWKYKSVSS